MSYGSYKGQCIGRVMHFLYEYYHRSDEWKFAQKTYSDPVLVLDQSESTVIATMRWVTFVNVHYRDQGGPERWVNVADVPCSCLKGNGNS